MLLTWMSQDEEADSTTCIFIILSLQLYVSNLGYQSHTHRNPGELREVCPADNWITTKSKHSSAARCHAEPRLVYHDFRCGLSELLYCMLLKRPRSSQRMGSQLELLVRACSPLPRERPKDPGSTLWPQHAYTKQHKHGEPSSVSLPPQRPQTIPPNSIIGGVLRSVITPSA